MRSRIHLTQSVGSDQGVHLRGGHRGVAQELLNHPDVSAALKQMRGERMPEGVRGDVLGDVGLLGRGLENSPGALPADPASAGIQEQRRRAFPFAANAGLPRTT